VDVCGQGYRSVGVGVVVRGVSLICGLGFV